MQIFPLQHQCEFFRYYGFRTPNTDVWVCKTRIYMNYRFYSGKNSAYFRHSSTAFISRQFWFVNAMRTSSPVFVNWISDLSKIHFMFSTFYWYKSKTYSEKVKPSNKEKKNCVIFPKFKLHKNEKNNYMKHMQGVPWKIVQNHFYWKSRNCFEKLSSCRFQTCPWWFLNVKTKLRYQQKHYWTFFMGRPVWTWIRFFT